MSLLFLLNPQNSADVYQKDAITFTWLSPTWVRR